MPISFQSVSYIMLVEATPRRFLSWPGLKSRLYIADEFVSFQQNLIIAFLAIEILLYTPTSEVALFSGDRLPPLERIPELL